MSWKRGAVILFFAGGLLLAAALATVPQVRWRAQLIGLKAVGQINDLSWGEMLRMLKPGSGFVLEPMVETHNAYSAISNPFQGDADVAAGKILFREQCAACHGDEGIGNSAPALNTSVFAHGSSDWWFYRVITRGIADTQMLGRELPERSVWQLVAYLRTLSESGLAGVAQAKQSTINWAPVTREDLLGATATPGNWLTYSGDYSGRRYSELAQIDNSNVDQLQIKWLVPTTSRDGGLEASPIVNNDVMIFTVPPNQTYAIDSLSGEQLWTHLRAVPNDLLLCCGDTNRGVAVAGGRVFVATLDAHLLALDAKSGRVLWDTTVADYKDGYSKTAAPLVVDNLVISGVAGGEFGIRGFLDAYDVETGERVWRFNTVPGPGEPGHETWAEDSWQHGGAPTWLTGSYDPQTDTIFWGVGNPGPLYQGDGRIGDNLYSNSVVALDVRTGKLKWHYQFTPHDERDWDANQIPVLVDRVWRGEPRQLLMTANRNAFFYVLDRNTGEFLLGEPFAYQNWAEGIDDDGRPIEIPGSRPTPRGAISWPASTGAANWRSPAYSPRTGLFYVAALEHGTVIYKQNEVIKWERGKHYFGSSTQAIERPTSLYTAVRAIDPETGKLAWEKRHPRRSAEWRSAGLVATAGDIIFGADRGKLFALDATTGESLWTLKVGGQINASPITYMAGEKQRITISAGRNLITLGLAD